MPPLRGGGNRQPPLGPPPSPGPPPHRTTPPTCTSWPSSRPARGWRSRGRWRGRSPGSGAGDGTGQDGGQRPRGPPQPRAHPPADPLPAYVKLDGELVLEQLVDVPALPEPPATHRGGGAGPRPAPPQSRLPPPRPRTPGAAPGRGRRGPAPLTHRVPSALDSRRNQSLSARLLFSTYWGDGTGGLGVSGAAANPGTGGDGGGPEPAGPAPAHLDEGAVLLLQPRRPALPVPRPRHRPQQRQLRHRPPRRLIGHLPAAGSGPFWPEAEVTFRRRWPPSPRAAILLRGVTRRRGWGCSGGRRRHLY